MLRPTGLGYKATRLSRPSVTSYPTYPLLPLVLLCLIASCVAVVSYTVTSASQQSDVTSTEYDSEGCTELSSPCW